MDLNRVESDVDPFEFPRTNPSEIPSEGQKAKIFATLEEAFREFDRIDDEQKVQYIVPQASLPPIPLAEDVEKHLFQNALLLIDGGEFALSRNILGDILSKNPSHHEAIRWTGWCFKQEGYIARAKEFYENLVSLRKTEQDFFELGEIYYQIQDNEKALQVWQQALDLCLSDSPLLFDIHKNLGNAFARLGDYDSAEENYHKALTTRPSSDVLQVNMGSVAFQRQEIMKAMSHYKQALELNPYNDRAWCGVGLVAREMKDPDWEKGAILKALDLNPENTLAREILSQWDKKL